jgi:TetR/AcrR family transcriptional regulator, tetracycline repressor protein
MRYATRERGKLANKDRASKPPATRSGRVPRNTLSRSRIVDAALGLIDAQGLAAVTMPRLAEHLGVGTMSLYRHIGDKDDLVNAVAEWVLSGVEVPDGEPDDWEGRVVGYLRALRAQALAHPALSGILADRGLTVGPVFDQLEAIHGILRAAGFSNVEAVRTFYALLTYVFGFVMWELPRVHQQSPAEYATAWNHSLDRLDPEVYPNLHAVRHQLTTTASPDQFEYGLDHLIRSLRPA